MKFEVKFEGFPINLKSRRVGLEHLDLARCETGVSNLDASRVNQYMADYTENPTIEIDEATARCAGHFQQNSWVRARCKINFEQFVSPVVVAQRDDTTGEVISVKFEYQLDKLAVLDAWKEAGYPLEWE